MRNEKILERANRHTELIGLIAGSKEPEKALQIFAQICNYLKTANIENKTTEQCIADFLEWQAEAITVLK